MKKFFAIFVTFTFLFASCDMFNLIDTSEDDDTRDSNGTYISVSALPKATSRTALPSVSDVNEFDSFTLTGTGTDENNNVLTLENHTYTASSTTSAYSMMNAARIPIAKGTWTFTLTATKGGASYGGTMADVEIEEGTNALTFTLSLTSFDTTSGTGGIKITLTYPAENVSKVTAGLYTTGGILVSGYVDESISTDGTVAFTKSGVPSGQYIIIFKFYAKNDVPLYVFREYAQVAKDLVSISNRMIENMESPYTLTYNMNSGSLSGGSSAPATYSRRSGDITLPILVRTGYIFGGWFMDSDFSSAQITAIPSGSTGNYVLYAKWIPIIYTIRFEANVPIAASAAVTGTTADLLATYDQSDALTSNGYSLSGYAFIKWNLEKDGSGREFINAASSVWNLSTEQDATVTLYAQWKEANARYTVRHFLQNIDDDSFTEDTSAVQDEGGVTDEQTTAVAKNTYTGFTPQTIEQKTVKSDNSTVVNVYYDRNSYTLSYEPNAVLLDGTADSSVSSISVAESRKYQLEKAVSSAIPTRTGYVFANWNTQADGGGTSYAAGASLVMEEADDVTLYAQWTANTYTVRFDGNVGETADGAKTVTQTMTYDSKAVLSENTFSLVGYVFDGWTQYADGTGKLWSNHDEVINLTAEKGGTYTLFVKWREADTSYTVEHYKQNASGVGYTIVTADTETKGGKTGEETTARARNYEGFTVQDFSQATIKNDGSTLIKIYYDRSPYTLSFNAGAGSGTMATQTFYNGILQAINANQFTRTGYSFAGWATESGGGTVYTDTASYAIGATDATLYATWKANNYKVTLSANDATTSGAAIVTATYDSVMPAIPTLPRREGYAFAGFYAAANGMGTQYYSAAGESLQNWNISTDTTLYAHWVVAGTSYKVEHYLQNTDRTTYTLSDTEILSRITGNSTAAVAKTTYSGFVTPSVTEVTTLQESIKSDGSTVIKIKYNRDTFSLSFEGNGNTGGSMSNQTFYYEVPQAIKSNEFAKTGYSFDGWATSESSEKLYEEGGSYAIDAADATLYATWKANTYTVRSNFEFCKRRSKR